MIQAIVDCGRFFRCRPADAGFTNKIATNSIARVIGYTLLPATRAKISKFA
ncbi:MAG TPA: hypothetical protein PKE69_20340 [Pyrinomonadaceae bacterium]|nr:hypothetical protein [Pyrinomonadaceae bacterium]